MKTQQKQNFRQLNHPYTMKIALIRTKSEKMTPLQNMNHPSRAKKTYKTKTAELVPKFAARWRSIRKNISSSDDKYSKKILQHNCNTKKVAPSYNKKKSETKKNQSKTNHISQLKLKNARTRKNSQRSQQQTRRHVSNFIKLIISI
jgi:hypothetical protein